MHSEVLICFTGFTAAYRAYSQEIITRKLKDYTSKNVFLKVSFLLKCVPLDVCA